MLTRGVRRLLVLHLLAALGIAGLAGAAPAQARGDICVGVLVDTTQLGGDVETGCATVPDGSDGVDVLDATGHELTVCRDGIVGEIDGRPADGCTTKDSTHYWSYWHRAAGSTSWTYATEGPSTYQPGNRSTEGWVFQDGRSESDNQPPPARAYRRICPKSASPSGSPPPTVGTNYKPPGAPTTPPPPPTATSAPAPTAAPAPAPVKRTHRQRQKHAATTSASPTPTPSDSISTTPSATPTRVVSLPDDNGSSGPPVGLIVGVAAAVALGGAAAWQVRRQRSSP